MENCFRADDGKDAKNGSPTSPNNHSCDPKRRDMYYQSERISLPIEACDGDCSISVSSISTISCTIDQYTHAATHPISKECIGRALQRSVTVKQGNNATYCDEQFRWHKEPRPVCPTREVVDFDYYWMNQAVACMDPAKFTSPNFVALYQKGMRLNPRTVFTIVNHESAANFNFISHNGAGVLQLSSVLKTEFERANSTFAKYWKEARASNPACAPLAAEYDRAQKAKVPYTCKMTDPKFIGYNYALGLSHLLYCQELAIADFPQIENKFSFQPIDKAEFKQIILNILTIACHNWGEGAMREGVKLLAQTNKKFTSITDFSNRLQSEGWQVKKSGIQNFIDLVQQDLQLVEGYAPKLNLSEVVCGI